LKSYFLRTSENNLVPTLSEFIRLNTDLVARSPPDSNKSAALQGYRVRLRPELQIQVVEDTSDWSCVLEERFKIQISSSRREKTYTMYSNENEHVGEQLLEDQRKRTREGETITSDTKKSNENDRIEISDDSEILDVEPLSGWEFDTPMPS
ncbi:9413_t:CDS:2, partial [Funneliformis caledonium]